MLVYETALVWEQQKKFGALFKFLERQILNCALQEVTLIKYLYKNLSTGTTVIDLVDV